MGSKSYTVAAVLGLSALLPGCTTQQHSIAVRPIGTPAETGPVADQLQHARSMLALNQPGLAIPILREVLRDAPDNADALNCLGVAYDNLGRQDLARRYFEQAMAKAPLDQRYASNLARLMAKSQGNEATETRLADASAEARPDVLSVAVPASQPTPQAADKLADLAPQPEVRLPSTESHPAAAAPQTIATALVATPVSLPSRGIFSVSMAPFDPRAALPQPRQTPVALRAKEPAAPAVRIAASSRIERLSLGEVRLVTMPAAKPTPAVRAHVVARKKSPEYWASLGQWLRGSALIERLNTAQRTMRLASLERSLAGIKAYLLGETAHRPSGNPTLSQAAARTKNDRS